MKEQTDIQPEETNKIIFNLTASKIFYIFIVCQITIWTLVPTLFARTLPRDTAEGIAWGFNWQLGYLKHPPLAAWLSNIAFSIEGSPGCATYLLAQICIALTFIAVWRFAKKFLPEFHALACVLALVGTIYYSFPSFRFNPDILSMPIYAFFMLFVYKACTEKSGLNWIVLAILAGLGFITKYEILVLFIPTVLFILILPKNRIILTKPLLLLFSFLVSLAIIIPNYIWLMQNDFLPLTYAMQSATSTDNMFNIMDHISNPFSYLSQIFITILPTIVLLAVLFITKKKNTKIEQTKYMNLFIIFILSGPFLFTFLVTLVLGSKINPYWTIPFFSYLGFIVLYITRPHINAKRMRVFTIICFIVQLLIGLIVAFALHFIPPTFNGATTEVQYPAQPIADYADEIWSSATGAPFKSVVGDYEPVSYINCYSPSRPKTYDINFGKNVTLTPTEIELLNNKNGAVFIWQPGSDSQIIPYIQKHFPNAKILPAKDIPWLQKSIAEQCKAVPWLSRIAIFGAKYIPVIDEKIKPTKIHAAVLIPNQEYKN